MTSAELPIAVETVSVANSSNALNTSVHGTNSSAAVPSSAKKQRSLRDFFSRQSVNPQPQSTTYFATKTPPRPARKRVFTSPKPKHDELQKRIQYDDSDGDGDGDDEEVDMDLETQRHESANHCREQDVPAIQAPRVKCVVPRNNSKGHRTAFKDEDDSQHSADSRFSPLNPNRLDFNAFSSQKSEPDLELPPVPATRPTVHRQWSNASASVDNLSLSMAFSRVYSQDEIDYLTPQDQPVIPLSHPATPSPMKKRHRRNDTPTDLATRPGQDNPDRHNNHAMMDVGTPVGGGATGAGNGATRVPPLTPLRATSGGTKHDTFSNFLAPTEWYTNPFAPPPTVVEKSRRRPSSSFHRSKRHSFPLSWNSSENNSLRAQPASKYLRDFIEKELVGSGSFSKVYKCIKKMDGWTYAVKKSRRHFRGRADTERALLEVQALAALSHSQHIIRYFDAWIEDQLLYIQLEHCVGCTLELFVEKFAPNAVPEEVLCKVLCHIAKALHDMHSLKMAHLDVKLQNVLVSAQGDYKLGDLGTVAHIDGNMEITEGDNRYLSRELLEGSRSNLCAGDIFALGATIYELLYSWMTTVQALGRSLPSGGEEWQQIRDGDLVVFREYSNPLQHLIASMMHPDPLQRPSAQEILQHEVVRPVV